MIPESFTIEHNYIENDARPRGHNVFELTSLRRTPKGVPNAKISRHRDGSFSTFLCTGFSKHFPTLSSAIKFSQQF